MSEPFDPERVASYDDCSAMHPSICIAKSDYDKLLELYRQRGSIITALDRECRIGCLSLPSVRNATDASHPPDQS